LSVISCTIELLFPALSGQSACSAHGQLQHQFFVPLLPALILQGNLFFFQKYFYLIAEQQTDRYLPPSESHQFCFRINKFLRFRMYGKSIPNGVYFFIVKSHNFPGEAVQQPFSYNNSKMNEITYSIASMLYQFQNGF